MSGQADQARSGLAVKTAGARHRVASAGSPVAGQVREQVSSRAAQAAQAGSAVLGATPEPVQQTARKLAGQASDKRVQAAVAAGSVLVVSWLVYRWLRR